MELEQKRMIDELRDLGLKLTYDDVSDVFPEAEETVWFAQVNRGNSKTVLYQGPADDRFDSWWHGYQQAAGYYKNKLKEHKYIENAQRTPSAYGRDFPRLYIGG